MTSLSAAHAVNGMTGIHQLVGQLTRSLQQGGVAQVLFSNSCQTMYAHATLTPDCCRTALAVSKSQELDNTIGAGMIEDGTVPLADTERVRALLLHLLTMAGFVGVHIKDAVWDTTYYRCQINYCAKSGGC